MEAVIIDGYPDALITIALPEHGKSYISQHPDGKCDVVKRTVFDKIAEQCEEVML